MSTTEAHTTTEVASLPACDICGDEAHYDAKTTGGPWGYLCEQDFSTHGVGLGLGRGQRLIVRA